MSSMAREDRLPRWEAALYIGIWTSALAKCCYTVYQASARHLPDIHRAHLADGWVPGSYKQKDASDFEWDFWSQWALRIGKWFMLHIAVSFAVRKYRPRWTKIAWIAISATSLYAILGWPVLLLFLVHFVIIYLTIFTKSVFCVWVVSVGLLSCLNVTSTLDLIRNMCPDDEENSTYYLVLLILSIKNLQYTSFALEAVTAAKTNGNNEFYSFTDLLVYVMYFPLFFTGPVLTYDLFIKQMLYPVASLTVGGVVREVVRLSFWVLFCEVCLHFMFFGAIQSSPYILEQMELWPLAGTAYCVGQFFMVKYVVLYGVPSLMAKLDGFAPPGQPKCVATVYLYSEMWKKFDRGLYGFLKRYIYVPLGGSQCGYLQQFLASFLCFSFVYIWHGADTYLLVWTIMNFAGIALEKAGGSLFTHPKIKQLIEEKLSVRWRWRLYGLLCVPIYLLFMIAIYVFLSRSTATGLLYARRLLVDGWPVSTLTLLTAFYGCILTSEILRAPRPKMQ